MKEQQRHKDAFELYFTFKQNGKSVEETIKLLQSDCNVTRKTLYVWKKEFDWDGREAIRANEIQKEVEQKTNTTIVDNKVQYLSFYHKLLEDLKTNWNIKIENITDLKKVIDGSLLLQGESTERTETNITPVFDPEIQKKILKDEGIE
jgi:hypothetical protein